MNCSDAVHLLRIRRQIVATDFSPDVMAQLVRVIDQVRVHHRATNNDCECWSRAITDSGNEVAA